MFSFGFTRQKRTDDVFKDNWPLSTVLGPVVIICTSVLLGNIKEMDGYF